MTEEQENKEWEEGINLHWDKGGKLSCMNCDWDTNDPQKARRHKQFHLDAPALKHLPRVAIGFWERII